MDRPLKSEAAGGLTLWRASYKAASLDATHSPRRLKTFCGAIAGIPRICAPDLLAGEPHGRLLREIGACEDFEMRYVAHVACLNLGTQRADDRVGVAADGLRDLWHTTVAAVPLALVRLLVLLHEQHLDRHPRLGLVDRGRELLDQPIFVDVLVDQRGWCCLTLRPRLLGRSAVVRALDRALFPLPSRTECSSFPKPICGCKRQPEIHKFGSEIHQSEIYRIDLMG